MMAELPTILDIRFHNSGTNTFIRWQGASFVELSLASAHVSGENSRRLSDVYPSAYLTNGEINYSGLFFSDNRRG